MLEYEALKPLFKFLNVPKMPHKHWSDIVGWMIVNCLHNKLRLR
jgi:hypothetical protein